MPKQIIALALVTREELQLLGPQFNRSFPIDETPCFGELLAAIDEADRKLWRERDREQAPDEQNGPKMLIHAPPARG